MYLVGILPKGEISLPRLTKNDNDNAVPNIPTERAKARGGEPTSQPAPGAMVVQSTRAMARFDTRNGEEGYLRGPGPLSLRPASFPAAQTPPVLPRVPLGSVTPKEQERTTPITNQLPSNQGYQITTLVHHGYCKQEPVVRDDCKGGGGEGHRDKLQVKAGSTQKTTKQKVDCSLVSYK